MYPHDSPKACCYSANDPARRPSPFYYWDVLLFIHHWLLGDAGWQGAEVAPHFPPLSPLSKPPPPPPLLLFFKSPLSFCFCSCTSMDGLCGRPAKVEQALFSSRPTGS